MNEKEIKAKELQKARDKAYYDWYNGIKEMLSDGVVHRVFDEDDADEDFEEAVLVHSNGVDCHVDRIMFNTSHNEFKVHFCAIDYRHADRWEFIYNVDRYDHDKIFENIIWKD